MKSIFILKVVFVLKISEAIVTGQVLRHSDNRCLAPKGLSSHPAEGTVIIHTSQCRDLAAFFRILENGAIQHIQSKLCIHLSGNRENPRNREKAILKKDCSDQKYFFTYTEKKSFRLKNKCLRPLSQRHPEETPLIIYSGCDIPITTYRFMDIVKSCNLNCLKDIIQSKQKTGTLDAFFATSESEAKTLSPVATALLSTLKAGIPELYKDLLTTFFPLDPNVIENLEKLVQHFGIATVRSYPSLLLAAAFIRRRQGVNESKPAVCGGTNRKIGGVPAIDEDDAKFKLGLSSSELAVVLDDEDFLAREAIDNERAADINAGVDPDTFNVSMVQKLIDHMDAQYYYQFWMPESLKTVMAECGVTNQSEIQFPPRGAGMTAIEYLGYLLSRNETIFPQNSLKFPWPLSIDLNIETSLRQCIWIWRRLENGEKIVRYSRYSYDYQKKSVACKKSDWNICSVPRIIEEGGVCGRQSTLARVTDHCLGTPSGFIKQPGHAAGYRYVKSQNKYKYVRYQSIKNMMNTWAYWRLTDDAMANIPKLNAEYHEGLANAMNHGYTSYRDGRAALLLYSRIYNITMRHESRGILVDALENNPHMMDVWMKLIHDITGNNALPVEGQSIFKRLPNKCTQLGLSDSQRSRLESTMNKHLKSYMQMYLEVLFRLISPPSCCSVDKPEYLETLKNTLKEEKRLEIYDYIFDVYLLCAAKSSTILDFLDIVQPKIQSDFDKNKIPETDTFSQILETLNSLIKSKEENEVRKASGNVVQFFEAVCNALPKLHVTASAWIIFPQYRSCSEAQLDFLNIYVPSQYEPVFEQWKTLQSDSAKESEFWVDFHLKGWLYGRSVDIVPLLTNVRKSIDGALIKEVKVNIAKNRPTEMSSTLKKETSSERAVDGGTDLNWSGGSCASTAKEDNPWFKLDLLNSSEVYGLLISNAEKKHGKYLQSFEIHIGDNAAQHGTTNPRCGKLHGMLSGETRAFYCDPPLSGRYVTINIPGNNRLLSICEIGVYNTELSRYRAHGVKLDIWYNLPTTDIQTLYDDPRYPNDPDEERLLTTFDYNQLGSFYGSRLSALYQAPASGNFTFYASCVDKCEVFLRDVDGGGKLEKIISLMKGTHRYQWHVYNEQKSKPIHLKMWKFYELVATVKEKSGQDQITLATELPNGKFVAPIPSERLFIELNKDSNVEF